VNPIKHHLLHKQQFAYKCGITLYHIFEDEWETRPEIVKSRIKTILGEQELKLNARKCTVRIITNDEKRVFLSANHLQGDDIAGIRYGLFHEEELVGCATFKPPSMIKGGKPTMGSFELSRLAFKINHVVRGGAGKLLKTFIREQQPLEIITYADRRWSLGGVYKNLGFTYHHASPPSYWYVKTGTLQRLHRSKFMKHRLTCTDDKLTEAQLMQKLGYFRIWDCGTFKYSLRIKR
jgi:hypothetical protein